MLSKSADAATDSGSCYSNLHCIYSIAIHNLRTHNKLLQKEDFFKKNVVFLWFFAKKCYLCGNLLSYCYLHFFRIKLRVYSLYY